MYSTSKIQLKQLSPILDLEVPIRELYKAVAALVADHTDKSNALTLSYGSEEQEKLTAISNMQAELGPMPTSYAHGLEQELYNAKSVYFGLAMKDTFLAAAIKGAVGCEEIRDYVSPEIKNKATVDLLKDIGMPTLAKIIDASCQPV